MASSDPATRRTRYDGATFRSLRERPCKCPVPPPGKQNPTPPPCKEHYVALTRVIRNASPRVGDDIFLMSREHIRQWERGQRNISDHLAARLAEALSRLTGTDVRPEDFEGGAAAA